MINPEIASQVTLLIVDRNPANIKVFLDVMGRHGISCCGASDYQMLDKMLADNQKKRLIVLIDFAGFEEAIWSRCRLIHRKKFPLLVMSSKSELFLQTAMLRAGASGYLKKPIALDSLVSLINSVVTDETEDENTLVADQTQ